ncbi:hypothetical protein CSUB01_04606 [Colletotrichum sublineola]|uniref:Uncharacterized protein n=1 Tax=Colletotrichum sublineola TaxID=1173701 RepID=A0A066X0U8_COLSU|nr:hypothetical protein CSUB01_04606 [Colletotrichum sublineola]
MFMDHATGKQQFKSRHVVVVNPTSPNPYGRLAYQGTTNPTLDFKWEGKGKYAWRRTWPAHGSGTEVKVTWIACGLWFSRDAKLNDFGDILAAVDKINLRDALVKVNDGEPNDMKNAPNQLAGPGRKVLPDFMEFEEIKVQMPPDGGQKCLLSSSAYVWESCSELAEQERIKGGAEEARLPRPGGLLGNAMATAVRLLVDDGGGSTGAKTDVGLVWEFSWNLIKDGAGSGKQLSHIRYRPSASCQEDKQDTSTSSRQQSTSHLPTSSGEPRSTSLRPSVSIPMRLCSITEPAGTLCLVTG